MDTTRHSSVILSGPADNEYQSDMLTGIINVHGIMSTDLNEGSAAKHTHRKGVLKRFRRWAGKKLSAICPDWPGRQRTSSGEEIIKMDTNRDLSERSTELDNNNEHQVDTLSKSINVTATMSTHLNETPKAVRSHQKGVFKRFRRWVGKKSRAMFCGWPRYQKQQQQDSISKPRSDIECVEVLTSNGSINNNLIGSDMNGNGGIVQEVTAPSLTINKPETVINNTPTDQIEKIDPVFKCWTYRYKLFSKFDDGIMLDRGSFFYVCPEVICKHIAVSCRFNVAINPFCGVGGMAIQLAMVCKSVIAMDIDADKIKLAKFNATLYGVQHKIKFVVGDFFATGETMKADIVVVSPSWGRKYWKKDVYPLSDLCRLQGGAENIMRIAKTIAPRVLMRLPTKASIDDCVRLGADFEMTNLEKCFLDGIPNCLIVRFCSLSRWFHFGRVVRISGSEGDGRYAGKSLVRRPRYCSTLVQLRSTGLRFVDRQREEESYFREYINSVMSFLAADDTNHTEPQNN